MKSIKKTVTTTNLNTGVAQAVTVYIAQNEENLEEYANEVVFVNNTGATIGILYLQTDDEVTLRDNYNQFYDFIPLDTGRSTGAIPHLTKYIYVKLLAGTATANLDFYLLSHTVKY